MSNVKSEDLQKLEAEVEEFRSGRKLAEGVQQRLKFLGEVKIDLEKRLNAKDEELKLYADLQSVLRRILNFQNIFDNIDKVRTLAENSSKVAQVSPSSSDGAAAVAVTEAIPEIHHKIERPVVQTDETSREGQLITLAYHGFFNEKKRLTEIGKEMQRYYLFTAANVGRDLSPILGKLVQLKILQREETPQGGWVYWLADGAKERIKEVSS